MKSAALALVAFLFTTGLANPPSSHALGGGGGHFGGRSKQYQGPFIVGEDAPVRQPTKVYLPVQYSEQSSWPVVVLLHGFTGTADGEDFYLKLSSRVSKRGFILVTPNGTLTPVGTRGEAGRVLDGYPFWNATDTCCDFGKTNVDDVGYLKRVLAEVKERYNVDASRIYLFGHSNGGFMANRMSCEIGEQLAAVASLAGGTYKSDANCKHPTPVPYLQIHAVDDQTIRYDDSPVYAGALATVQHWKTRNACPDSLAPQTSELDNLFLIPSNDTAVQSWESCATQKPVVLWTIKAYKTSPINLHEPHIPLFNSKAMDRVLDFFFSHRL